MAGRTSILPGFGVVVEDSTTRTSILPGFGVVAETAATAGGDTNVNANVDALTLTEFAATVNAETNVNANVDALTLTTFAASVNAETNVNASVDALTLTTFAASIVSGTEVQAGVAALTLTALQASINAETNVQAGTDALVLTEYAATITPSGAVAAGKPTHLRRRYTLPDGRRVEATPEEIQRILEQYIAAESSDTSQIDLAPEVAQVAADSGSEPPVPPPALSSMMAPLIELAQEVGPQLVMEVTDDLTKEEAIALGRMIEQSEDDEAAVALLLLN